MTVLTTLEILGVLLIALGFVFEHKLIKFEDKILALLKSAVRRKRARSVVKMVSRSTAHANHLA